MNVCGRMDHEMLMLVKSGKTAAATLGCSVRALLLLPEPSSASSKEKRRT